MKVLFVTPVKEGSGETITCLHFAERLAAQEHTFLFLASQFAKSFISGQFPNQVVLLSNEDQKYNHQQWLNTLSDFAPDVIVFADYPLMFFPGGTAPLAQDPDWVKSLDDLPTRLVTLDHFGFAQREMGLYPGPPHINISYLKIPAIPQRMQIMLPCPMNEPGYVKDRIGLPFRYWEVPFQISDEQRRAVRQKYLDNQDDYLIFHSTPNWAWRHAQRLGLSFYSFYPQILEYYLGDAPRPVTVVSVNNGELFQALPEGRLRIKNLPPIPKTEFEGLLFGSDLVITENSISISMGKAICGFQPCASLKNSYRVLELSNRLHGWLLNLVTAMESLRLGSVFPFEVFPTVVKEDLDAIGLYRDNSLTQCFWKLEVFGDEETKTQLHRIIADPACSAALNARQEVYVSRLQQTPDAVEVLESIVENEREGRIE